MAKSKFARLGGEATKSDSSGIASNRIREPYSVEIFGELTTL